MKLRFLTRATAVVAIALVSVGGTGPASAEQPAIESTYGVAGSWEVATSSTVDAQGLSYDVWHPKDLGAGGFRHPIVAWANGTLTPSARYAALLEHLASWGFVVVAPNDLWTGSGREVLAVLADLTKRGQDPQSPFYDKLDPTRIGASGHSQGAYGVLNAALKSNGLIRTVVPIHLPDLVWLNPSHVADLGALTQPVLIVGGGSDWLSTPSGFLAYLDCLPSAVTAALLTGASHDAVIADADGYLGYITAWMMYQLQDDQYAGSAFVGQDAEINSNSAWVVLTRQPVLLLAAQELVVGVVEASCGRLGPVEDIG